MDMERKADKEIYIMSDQCIIDNIILEEENKKLKKENEILKEKVDFLLNIVWKDKKYDLFKENDENLKTLVEEVMMGTCFSQGIIIPTKVNE